MKTLETERLILREWKREDIEDFHEYAEVEGVGEMAGWPHHKNMEESIKVLKSFIESGEVYALELKASGKVIGSLGLHHKTLDTDYKAIKPKMIGYVLSKDYWGQGLAIEAVDALLSYAFQELDVDVIWCAHFDFNRQSQRVIEKAGFEFYREKDFEARLLNKIYTEKQYILTAAKWKKNALL